MSDFVRAVKDTRHELHRRGYDPQKAIVYCHAITLENTKDELDTIQPFNQGSKVFGMTIETTPNVPKDLVVTVHLGAMRLGPKAIAFAEVDNESD